MTGFENQTLRGITLKNMIVTVVCTASIVASVVTTYFQLSDQIKEQRFISDTQYKIFELRLKIAETQIQSIKEQMDSQHYDKK